MLYYKNRLWTKSCHNKQKNKGGKQNSEIVHKLQDAGGLTHLLISDTGHDNGFCLHHAGT